MSELPATTRVTPSVLVMARVAWELRESVSVALTVEAPEAEADAVLV